MSAGSRVGKRDLVCDESEVVYRNLEISTIVSLMIITLVSYNMDSETAKMVATPIWAIPPSEIKKKIMLRGRQYMKKL